MEIKYLAEMVESNEATLIFCVAPEQRKGGDKTEEYSLAFARIENHYFHNGGVSVGGKH